MNEGRRELSVTVVDHALSSPTDDAFPVYEYRCGEGSNVEPSRHMGARIEHDGEGECHGFRELSDAAYCILVVDAHSDHGKTAVAVLAV